MTARDAIIERRFLHKGETDERQVWRRVADAWATSADEADEFEAMFVERRAFPNTPALANAGRRLQMGSACFVLPFEDSLDGIMTTLHNAAMVQKAGGGTGFDYSPLRPKGALVNSTGRGAPGPVAFLRMSSDVFDHITQAGLRPAANMAHIHIDHRDALEFITCKRLEGAIPNFNISPLLTDDFMAAFSERHWSDSELGYAIVDGAWRNGEPGGLFIDTVNRFRLHPELISATNPCGEVPLLPFEACVLGSVNLAAHIRCIVSGSTVREDVNWPELEQTIRTLTRLLDNIVDKQDYPLPIIRDTHHRYRKIGAGVMGYADALILLGMRYGSPNAIRMADEFAAFLQDVTYDESERLGVERGLYPGWREGMPKRRNLCCQVIAPTGTLARLAGCSFGLEPNFAREWTSYVVGGAFKETHPLAYAPDFVEAADVTVEQHLETQAAFQRHVDQAVSKTLNLPNSATRDDVQSVFVRAWQLGLKGVTMLRDGARDDVVIKSAQQVDCATGVCAL